MPCSLEFSVVFVDVSDVLSLYSLLEGVHCVLDSSLLLCRNLVTVLLEVLLCLDKKPKVRNNSIRGINPYQCAIRASINYSSFGFYTEYSLTPLFRKGVGPEGNIFSLGAAINIGGIKF